MAYGYVPPATYRDPNDKYSAKPQGNYAQESDFFKANPYGGDPYAKITANLTDQGNSYLNRNPRNPFGAGGPLSTGGNFGQAFGYSGYGDINSPWSKAQLTTHMTNLRGGEQNLVDQYTRGAANAGVTSSRGGMGITGGASPEAQLQQNAMRTIANLYGQNYGQSMNYLKSSADSMDAQAAEMARLYGTIYGVNASTGTNLMGQALQGTKYGADDENAYRDKMFEAYSRDTANTNRLREGEADREWQRKQRVQQQADQQAQRDKAAELERLLKGSTIASRDTWRAPGLMMSDYLKSEGVMPNLPQTGSKTPGNVSLNPYKYKQTPTERWM